MLPNKPTNVIINGLTLLLLTTSIALAQISSSETKTITLQDGTTLKGQVVGFQNGIYTIQTALFGQINLKDSEIVNIGAGPALTNNPSSQAPTVQPNTQSAETNQLKMQALGVQQQLLSDPDTLMQMQAMLQDPQIMQILNDPEFVKAATNYDLQKIQNDPRTQQLMNNPQMQKLLNKMTNQNSSGQKPQPYMQLPAGKTQQ